MRKWLKILETVKNGTAVWGMKSNIKSAIYQAANIRVSVLFNPVGEYEFKMFFTLSH